MQNFGALLDVRCCTSDLCKAQLIPGLITKPFEIQDKISYDCPKALQCWYCMGTFKTRCFCIMPMFLSTCIFLSYHYGYLCSFLLYLAFSGHSGDIIYDVYKPRNVFFLLRLCISEQSLTLNVRKIFSDIDAELFEGCLQKFEEDQDQEEEIKVKRETTWKRLEEIAAMKATSNELVLVS